MYVPTTHSLRHLLGHTLLRERRVKGARAYGLMLGGDRQRERSSCATTLLLSSWLLLLRRRPRGWGGNASAREHLRACGAAQQHHQALKRFRRIGNRSAGGSADSIRSGTSFYMPGDVRAKRARPANTHGAAATRACIDAPRVYRVRGTRAGRSPAARGAGGGRRGRAFPTPVPRHLNSITRAIWNLAGCHAHKIRA